ncbi:hypothetical protein ACHAQD_007432 [Fusarium lateritium]
MHNQRQGRHDLTGEELNDIMYHTRFKEIVDDGVETFVPLSEKEKQELKKNELKPKSKRPSQEPVTSPELLLRSLTLTLSAEARDLAFPRFEMFVISRAIFRKMQERCIPLLNEVFGPNDVFWTELNSLSLFIISTTPETCDDDRALSRECLRLLLRVRDLKCRWVNVIILQVFTSDSRR